MVSVAHIRRLIPILIVMLVGGAGLSQAGETGRMVAAVYLVRGSVSGGNVGSYGVFVRDGTDTSWTKITRSNVITFGLASYQHGSTSRYYIAGGNGLHRSTDGGNTWRILTSWRTEEILCVVPDPVDSAVIYVATPQGIFKTTDDGETWLRKMDGFKKWFVQKIILDAKNRRTLYATCEDDLYRSTNAGEHWRPLHVGASGVLTVMQLPSIPRTFLVGLEDGGIRRSTDGGATWEESSGLKNASVYALRSSPDGHDLYAAGWKTGLWTSRDEGETWERLWAGPEAEAIQSILVDPADGNHLLISAVDLGVFESFDCGKTWRRGGLWGAQVKQLEIYP